MRPTKTEKRNMNMNEINANKIADAYKSIDKTRVWNTRAFSRVYVGSRGRFIQIDNAGVADVTGMVIHQAQAGAMAICENLGINVAA